MTTEIRDQLTQSVKELAKDKGAVLVGVAPVERFDPMPPLGDAAPKGHHPKDFLPEAMSVISFAMPILEPVMTAPAFMVDKETEMIPDHAKYPYMETFYNRVGHVVHDNMLEFIGQMLGQFLLTHGHQTMIFPTTGLHPHVDGLSDVEIWEGPDSEKAPQHTPFRYTYGPFSHRHAATRAGLGEFGYNNVVLTKEFGPRQRFNSIITDADLTPDPLLEEPICLRESCRLCLEACPVDCITMRDDEAGDDYRSVGSADQNQIFIDTPARTDPTVCRRRRDDYPDSPIRGDCIRVCPVPEMPKHLPQRLQKIVDAGPYTG